MFLPAATHSYPSLRRTWRASARPFYSMRSASASTLARSASTSLVNTETRIGDRGHGKVTHKHGKAHGNV